MDSFLTITSTKNDLESTSFLSSLDMDPTSTAQLSSNLTSPAVSLPLVDGQITPLGTAESLFAALSSPPISGPPTGSSATARVDERREVFSDFRRFVSGFRRDSQLPP